MRPNGVARPSCGYNLSASHAPPVYSPIIAVVGFTSGLSSATSFAQRASASGSIFVEVLLQDQLGGRRISALFPDGLVGAGFTQSRLGVDRGVALVDQADRQSEPAFELARETLRAAREVVLRTVGRQRQADY